MGMSLAAFPRHIAWSNPFLKQTHRSAGGIPWPPLSTVQQPEKRAKRT